MNAFCFFFFTRNRFFSKYVQAASAGKAELEQLQSTLYDLCIEDMHRKNLLVSLVRFLL